MELVVTGKVEPFADIQPERARLTGRVGDPVSVTVRIAPRPDHPFKIKNVRTMRGDAIRSEINSREADGKPYYELTISSTRQEPGRIVDVIYVETDSRVRPQLQVHVFGEIIPALK
ncbi:MAG: hypothetical protein MUD16_11045 [Desulfobacterales bacterium]|nr:hypothetical protein [Desulfobacterales bacterium]